MRRRVLCLTASGLLAAVPSLGHAELVSAQSEADTASAELVLPLLEAPLAMTPITTGRSFPQTTPTYDMPARVYELDVNLKAFTGKGPLDADTFLVMPKPTRTMRKEVAVRFPIPEPSSIALLGLTGTVGLVAQRVRRKKWRRPVPDA